MFKKFFVIIIWVIFFVAILPLATEVEEDLEMIAMAQTQSSFSVKTLTNDDIISLVKAGLSDAAIVSLIQGSQTQFDLSPNSLIKLKEAGVSNTVIEAMIKSHTPSTTSPKASLIPAVYGYYVVDGEQLRELEPVSVVTKMGLQPGGPRSGNPGSAMDGFAGEPLLSIDSQSPIFIVYQQDVDINDFHLSDLVYVRTQQAYQFNKLGTNPAFFRSTYFRDYYDVIQIDLWRPKNEVPLRIEPVEGKSGMYRLIPKSELKQGRYTLYYGDAVHPDGFIFSTFPNRQSSAFYFKIGNE